MFDPKSFPSEEVVEKPLVEASTEASVENPTVESSVENPTIESSVEEKPTVENPDENLEVSLTIVFKPLKSQLKSWCQNFPSELIAANSLPAKPMQDCRSDIRSDIRKDLIKNGLFAEIDTLLQKGAVNPCTEYKSGGIIMPALCYAVKCGKPLTADTLLKHGANVNCVAKSLAEPEFVDYPLLMACRSQNTALIKLLLANGANIDIHDHAGKTPLHVLLDTKDNKDENIMALIDAIAEQSSTNKSFSFDTIIDAKDANQETPLIKAVKNASLLVIYRLAQMTKEINAVDSFGRTALWYAVQTLNKNSVDILLNHGADPRIGIPLPHGVGLVGELLSAESSPEDIIIKLIHESIWVWLNKNQSWCSVCIGGGKCKHNTHGTNCTFTAKSNVEPETLPDLISAPEINLEIGIEPKPAEVPKKIPPKFCYRLRKTSPLKQVKHVVVVIRSDNNQNIFKLHKGDAKINNVNLSENDWDILLPLNTEFPLLLNEDKLEEAMGPVNKFYMCQFLEYLQSKNIPVFAEYVEIEPAVIFDYFLNQDTYFAFTQAVNVAIQLDNNEYYRITTNNGKLNRWKMGCCAIKKDQVFGLNIDIPNIGQSGSIVFDKEYCGENGLDIFIKMLTRIAKEGPYTNFSSFDEFVNSGTEPIVEFN